MIRAEQGGESSPELVALGVELEIAGHTYIVRFGGEVADRGTFTLDGDGKLTLIGIEGPNSGRAIPCIYQRAGDRLRVRYGYSGTSPDSFVSNRHIPDYVATYRMALGRNNSDKD